MTLPFSNEKNLNFYRHRNRSIFSIFEPLCVFLEMGRTGVSLVNVEVLRYFKLNFLVYSLVTRKIQVFLINIELLHFLKLNFLVYYFINEENLDFSYTLNYSTFFKLNFLVFFQYGLLWCYHL